MSLDDLVKLGLAYEHTNTKSDQLGGSKDQDASVRRVIQEEVKRMNNGALATPGQQIKVKCQTCTRKHNSGVECPGLKCKECFDCREPGHFKGAPCCKKPKKKKPVDKKKLTKGEKDKNKSRRVKDKSSSSEDTDDTDSDLSDSVGRVRETVHRSSQSKLEEPNVGLEIRSREGTEYLKVKMLPDSGVYRTLITEREYHKLVDVSPGIKLRKNHVKFTPYASDKVLPVLGRIKLVIGILTEKGLNRWFM